MKTSLFVFGTMSDRTTPFLAIPPIWKDDESLKVLRLVATHSMLEVFYRLKARTRNVHGKHTMSAVTSGATPPLDAISENDDYTVTVASLAGFVGGYSLRASNRQPDLTIASSPEIGCAIPVEPEISRAIPIEPKIRQGVRLDRRQGSESGTDRATRAD